MAERPNESITNKVETERKNYLGENNYTHHEHKTALSSIEVLQKQLRDLGNNKDNTQERVRTSIGNWIKQIDNLENCYKRLHKKYDYLLDHEITVQRVESKAAWRNLFFRVGTTGAIALTLAICYSIAANVDWIYLPLQQKTIIHLYEDKLTRIAPDPDKYDLICTDTRVTSSIRSIFPKLSSPLQSYTQLDK